jgi:hypothetical protein
MTIPEISKVFQRSIDAMSAEQKKAVREAIEVNGRSQIRADDYVFLCLCGISPD